MQLVLAAVVIGLGTGALFYFTTRNIFGRSWDPQSPPPDPMANVVSLEHGLKVYAANCAMCHGPSGLGDGAAAAQLNPKPRDFSTGWFKIGDTRSGLPTDHELETSIRRGLFPLMPPWPRLSDGEVKSVALAVRHLALEGVVSSRLAHDQKASREDALKIAHARLDSGEVIVLPPRPAKIDLARGKTFFLNNCAACHDPDGRGRLREDLVDNNDNPIMARDLTSGKFKGGNSVEDIAMRMMRGIPGSPMPAMVEISPDDLWSTAEYVRTLFEQALAGK
jgi:cytochrome c oxidase cbb3-type subunit 2